MRRFYGIFMLFAAMLNCGRCDDVVYEATWESLDKRPLPQWYDDAKFGILLHWGVFSVPAFGNEWFWKNLVNGEEEFVNFFKANYPPNYTYQNLASQFTAEFYDPESWADLFKKAGAKYVVLTTKHHEGYTLWPSKVSFGWNANDVGPHRDLVGDLAAAIRSKTDIKFGLYYSLFEWFNPLYLADVASNYTTNDFVTRKTMPELKELVTEYKPEVIWSDGVDEAPDEYWQSKEFLSWLYNESPVKDTVVVNDKWGKNTPSKHGGFFNYENQYDPGTLQKHKWESVSKVYNKSWSHIRNSKIEDYQTPGALIALLARTVSCGGNLLLNVGPTKEGTIDPIYQERLLQMGEWLTYNGEAIYGTSPWSFQDDSNKTVWYTAKNKTVYAIIIQWPADNVLKLTHASDLFKTNSTSVSLLGNSLAATKWSIDDSGVVSIVLPSKAVLLSDWAWTLKIEDYE